MRRLALAALAGVGVVLLFIRPAHAAPITGGFLESRGTSFYDPVFSFSAQDVEARPDLCADCQVRRDFEFWSGPLATGFILNPLLLGAGSAGVGGIERPAGRNLDRVVEPGRPPTATWCTSAVSGSPSRARSCF
jgi:hypothetical protein